MVALLRFLDGKSMKSASQKRLIPKDEVDYTIEKMPQIVKKLRKLSPFVEK
ncbi:unnamed protein product [marine sediment metagenome]|uniref:Uncharacterized protein n=1 Tax=marine sediment metagenome TaxID=412755 RepID=X0TZC9_9ZZZZ